MTSIQDYDSDSDSSAGSGLECDSEEAETAALASSFQIDFPIFLQNYTANMRHLLSLYLYLPLNPLLHTRKLFRKATKAVLESVPPLVANKYTWEDIGMKLSKVKYHASISGNYTGAPHQIKHFQETFAHGLLKIAIDPKLIALNHEHDNHDLVLQKVLGVDPSKHPRIGRSTKGVKLLLEPRVNAFISEALIKIYLSVPIEMGTREHRFFNDLQALTESAAASAELTAGINPGKEPHVTFSIGTVKDLAGDEFDIHQDLETIRDCLKGVDLSSILRHIPIYTDSVAANIKHDNSVCSSEFLLPTT